MPKATENLSYGVMPREGAAEIALSPSLAQKFAEDIQTLLGKTVVLEYGGEVYPLPVSGIYNAGYDDFFISVDVERQLYQPLPDGQQNYSMEVEGGEIKSVPTNRGTVYPALVINAAGVFAEDVARMAGDRFFSIHPRRGTNSILDKKAWARFSSIASVMKPLQRAFQRGWHRAHRPRQPAGGFRCGGNL